MRFFGEKHRNTDRQTDTHSNYFTQESKPQRHSLSDMFPRILLQMQVYKVLNKSAKSNLSFKLREKQKRAPKYLREFGNFIDFNLFNMLTIVLLNRRIIYIQI